MHVPKPFIMVQLDSSERSREKADHRATTEEQRKKVWNYTGSPYGISLFRQRLQRRPPQPIHILNIFLVCIVIYLCNKIWKKFCGKDDDEENQDEEKTEMLAASRTKIRRIDTMAQKLPYHVQEVVVEGTPRRRRNFLKSVHHTSFIVGKQNAKAFSYRNQINISSVQQTTRTRSLYSRHPENSGQGKKLTLKSHSLRTWL